MVIKVITMIISLTIRLPQLYNADYQKYFFLCLKSSFLNEEQTRLFQLNQIKICFNSANFLLRILSPYGKILHVPRITTALFLLLLPDAIYFVDMLLRISVLVCSTGKMCWILINISSASELLAWSIAILNNLR